MGCYPNGMHSCMHPNCPDCNGTNKREVLRCPHGTDISRDPCQSCHIDLLVGAYKTEAAKLRTELKNFLDAFDEYFADASYCKATPSVLSDLKQAMFSAANQARKVLG